VAKVLVGLLVVTSVMQDLHVGVIVRALVGQRHNVIQLEAGGECGDTLAAGTDTLIAQPDALTLAL
jgi:hypothetical protein